MLMFNSGVVASLIRLRWVSTLAEGPYFLFNHFEYITIWSTIEQGMGITAASISTLRPLLKSSVKRYRYYRSTYTFSTNRSNPRGTTTTASAAQKTDIRMIAPTSLETLNAPD